MEPRSLGAAGLSVLRDMSFSRWVFLLQVLATLPVLALALWMTHALVQERESQQKQALMRRTEAAALTLARELDSARVAVRGLLLSEAALQGDLRGIQTLATRAVAADSDLVAISAWMPGPHRVFSVPQSPASTTLPGQTPDVNPSTEALQAAFEADGETLLPLDLANRDRICLVAPWNLPGSKALLRVSMRRQTLASVLIEQRWPDAWTVSLIDSRMQVVVRNRAEAEFLGREVLPELQAHIRQGARGLVEAKTLDGTPSLVAVAAVPGTRWWVAAAVPLEVLKEQAQGPLKTLLGGGLLLVLICSGAATMISRSLVRQVNQAAGQELHDAALAADAAEPAGVLGKWRGLRVRELLHIQRRQARSAQALEQARHDSLTQLPGRVLFMEQLLASLAVAREHQPVQELALLYLDLDGFKATNDRLGHAAGDQLLSAFGQMLRNELAVLQAQLPALRLFAGRLGGDEFAISLSADQAQELARQLAQRLLAEVPRLGNAVGVELGCSLGLALAGPEESAQALVERADLAMLSAKRAGKRQLVLAAPPSPSGGA